MSGPDEDRIQKREVRFSASWEAPLPPPGLFQAYENVLTGCAARLVRMAEREQDNRHKTVARGQLFAFLLGFIGMVSGTVLIAFGKSAAALIPLVAAIVPLIAGFLGGRRGEDPPAGEGSGRVVAPPKEKEPH